MSETLQTSSKDRPETVSNPSKLRQAIALTALAAGVGGGLAGYAIANRPSAGVKLSVSSDGTTEQFEVIDTFPAISGDLPNPNTSVTEIAGSVNCLTYYQGDVGKAVRFRVLPSMVSSSQVKSFEDNVGDACDGSVPDPNAQNWIFASLAQAGMASDVVSVS